MFGKKKGNKRTQKSDDPFGFDLTGSFDPTNMGNDNGDDDDDEDLEAELHKLMLNDDVPPSRPARRPRPQPVNLEITDNMDIDSDQELSGDDDDPELLNELNAMMGEDESPKNEENVEESPAVEQASEGTANQEETIKLLEERLGLYKAAEQKAKNNNEASKVRRFGRGVKTLQEMLRDAKAGKNVDSADIPPPLPRSATQITDNPAEQELDSVTNPPEVVTDASPPENPSSEAPALEPEAPALEPEAPAPIIDEEKLELLKKRQQEYRIAAVAWKRCGNLEEAVKFVKIAKQFDVVIAALNSGQPVDLSEMPSTPELPKVTVANDSSVTTEMKKVENTTEESSEAPKVVPKASSPITGNDIAGALQERLEVYRKTKAAAEEEGNASKARRYGRICKQYEDAIKLHARGKPIPVNELPVPPGYPPIALNPPASVPVPSIVKEKETPEVPEVVPEASSPITGNDIAEALQERLEVYRKTKAAAEEEGNASKARRYGRICQQYEDAIKLHARSKLIPVDELVELPVPPGYPPLALNQRAAGTTTRAQKQTLLLQKRQAELKRAALMAKKSGNLELARDYLRQAKGIDPLIHASNCGLPVDMSSVPLSPNAKTQLNDDDDDDVGISDGFALVSTEDCEISESGTAAEIYENLEKLLIKQKKACLATRDHCKAIGDVPEYNRWERMALGYSRDLDMLRVRKWDDLPPPQHHYEQRTHTIVKCCTDLTDSDLEISIIRGINYAKEADTYVMYEFPYPSDYPPSDRTSTVKNSCNPEYDATFTLTGSVDRSSRQCQRAFKRHALKCQVKSKGGFLRSDNLLGTVTVKLQPLETQCVLHDSFPLMNGRKAAGGKLEVKIRLRNPIMTKQMEKMTERWLVIDN